MSFDRVAEFYKRAVADHRFSEDFLDEAKSISSEDELRDFFKEKVLPIAKSMGYDFTVDELMSYEREVACELSEEELESVTGGVSIKSISVAFASLFVLMGNVQPMSSAMLSRDAVLQSANILTGKSETIAPKVAAAVAAEISDANVAEDVSYVKEGLDRSDVCESVEPCKSISSRYVCKALNLLDPYALKMTGATSDMRFFDGNTESLKVYGDVEEGKVPTRKYNEDQGKGSPNYMRTLFPSSAGELSTAGGSENFARLTADCNPSPELVARTAAYFYNFRNAENKDDMIKTLNVCGKNVEKLSQSTDEKLANSLYDVIEKYQNARNSYDNALKDESNTTVHKSMTVGQYLNSRGKVNYTISDDLLGKIKLTFFKIHSSEDMCKATKEKIESTLAKTGADIDQVIEKLTYDQVKDKAEIMDELKKLDTDVVLNDMKTQMSGKDKVKDKNKSKVVGYQSVLGEFTSELQKSGPKETIGFDAYVSAKFKKNKDAICAIDKEAQSKYKDLLAEMQDASKDDASKKAYVAKAIKENHSLLEGLKTEKEEKDLQEVYKFFEANNMSMDVSKESLRTDSGVKKAKAIISVLKEGAYMIQHQETDDDKGTRDKYPKYTTERMLMSYFIEQFNESSDVNRFYDEIDKLIEPDEKSDDTMTKDRLDIMAKVIKEMPTNENVPLSYAGVDLISNGPTKTISVPETNAITQKEEVSFSGSLADCADTAARHFLNLLFYSIGEKWIPGVVNDELESAKEAVVAAINDENKSVEFRRLKDRVQMFYLHQTPSEVNDGSELTRSLWNYVVSNMNNELPDSGFYSIRYEKGNYELDTGFINMLKLIYNIEKAIYGEESKKTDALEKAYKAIKDLDDRVGDLAGAFESVIHVVKPDVTVKMKASLDEFQEGYQDIYGDLKVELKMSADAKDDICFIIYQSKGHAFLDLNKSEQKALDINLGEFKDDPIINFFVKRVFANVSMPVEYDSFYELLKAFDSSQNSKCLANSNMLRLIKEAAGENEENYYRLYELCEKYFSASAKVSMDKNVDLFGLFQNMYRVSKLKYFGLEATDFKDAEVEVSQDGNYKYKQEGGVVEICPTAKLKDAKSITIPANIGGSKKYIISAGAFIGFTNLKEVNFAKGIESVTIGDFAFSGGSVEKVNIPSGVQAFEVGVRVFNDAKILGELNIADEVQNIKIGGVKFSDNKLDNIVVPGDVEEYSIPTFAFERIKLSENVTISSKGGKIKKISVGGSAFQGSSVVTLNIEDVAEKVILESEALANSKVNKLTVSEGLKSLIVEDMAFIKSDIENIIIPNSVEELRLSHYDRFAASKSGKLEFGSNVKKLTIGGGVLNTIKEDEIIIDNNLDELILENSSDFIAKKLIIKGIKKLSLGSYLGELETLDLQGVEVLTLNDYIFVHSKVKNLNLGKSLKQVNLTTNAFSEGKNLSVSCDHEIESLNLLCEYDKMLIDKNTFAGFQSVGIKSDRLKISDCVKTLTVESYSFLALKGKELTIPEGVKELTLNRSVFSESEIETLNLKGVETLTIEDDVFYESSISRLNFDKVNNLTLSGNAFKGFKGKELTIPAGVKKLTLYWGMFSDSELEILNLEGVEELTIIGDIYFGSKLKTLNINSKLKKVEMTDDIFSDKIVVHDEKSRRLLEEARSKQMGSMVGDILEEEIKETMYGVLPEGAESTEFDLGQSEQLTLNSDVIGRVQGDTIKIPETVKDLTIGEWAFSNSNIKDLDLGAVERLTLNGYGFSNFKGEGLKIPDTVKDLTIVEWVFSGSEIKDLDLGAVECLTLNGYGFGNFKGETLKIPKSVVDLRLEGNAFSCSSIQTLDIESKLEEDKIAGFAFYSDTLQKIVVHDEDSRKLLEDNRLKYGISDEVKIELDLSVSQQRD